MIALGSELSRGPLFAFAGGGTGGHLYPAIAVAAAIRERIPDARFVFFGTRRTIDQQILSQVDAELVRQPLAPLSLRPWNWPSVYRGWRGSLQMCRTLFDGDAPCVVIGTGGMASAPAAREASRMGIPIAIFNPDAIPGRANRWVGRWARVVFAQWPVTRKHFPSETDVQVLGCPVRPSFTEATREEGLARFDLDPHRRTLLVTGASLGARTVNEAVIANLEFLETHSDWQILHLTGQNDHPAVLAAYAARRSNAKVLAYTENMAEALAAADLVVARAGASTLAELTAVGRASILMPYPFHRDQHQYANAKCLADQGAARIVRDAADGPANASALRQALSDLLTNHAPRDEMAQAARRLGRPDAARHIADGVLKITARNVRASSCESVEALCSCTR